MHDHRRRPRRSALRALILAGLAMAAPAAAATRGYTITSFDSIRVDAPVTVTLVTGLGPSARAEGDQAMLDRLHAEDAPKVVVLGFEPEDALARIEQMAKRSHEAFQRNKQDFEARTSKAKEEFARLAKTFDDEHKGIATEAGDGEGEEGAEAPPAPTPSAQPPAPAPGDAPASEEQGDEEQDSF